MLKKLWQNANQRVHFIDKKVPIEIVNEIFKEAKTAPSGVNA